MDQHKRKSSDSLPCIPTVSALLNQCSNTVLHWPKGALGLGGSAGIVWCFVSHQDLELWVWQLVSSPKQVHEWWIGDGLPVPRAPGPALALI